MNDDARHGVAVYAGRLVIRKKPRGLGLLTRPVPEMIQYVIGRAVPLRLSGLRNVRQPLVGNCSISTVGEPAGCTCSRVYLAWPRIGLRLSLVATRTAPAQMELRIQPEEEADKTRFG